MAQQPEMTGSNDRRRAARHRRLRIMLGCLALPGVVLAALVVVDHSRVYLLTRDILGSDAAIRIRALTLIADRRDRRATEAVLAVLKTAEDRATLSAAGRAAMRIGDRRALELLRQRADAGPDDPTRAQLILNATRLSNRDHRLIDWLEAGVKSPDPWRRIGSAVGLLQLGHPEAGLAIIDLLRKADGEVRAFGLREFRAVANPVAQAIGQPTTGLNATDPGPSDNAAWDTLAAFWQGYATVELLNDVLRRLERRDPDWYELNRLLHARDRLARWLQ